MRCTKIFRHAFELYHVQDCSIKLDLQDCLILVIM
jgi:hypothetical protein